VHRGVLSPDNIREHDIQFVTAGPGRYRLLVPGIGFILTQEGEPYEINLNDFNEIAPVQREDVFRHLPRRSPDARGRVRLSPDIPERRE
jgi:hypothetical protein